MPKTKKILLERNYDQPLSIYGRFVGMIIPKLFAVNVSLWNQCKYIALLHLTFSRAKFWSFCIKC